MFIADFKYRNCRSDGCASAVNAIGSDADIFNGHSFSVNDWLLPDIFTLLLKKILCGSYAIEITC